MAKTPAKPKLELTRAQQLTMGVVPKKETTDGKAAHLEPSAPVESGDEPAQADGVRDAD
jgi:hypothetical protein